MAVEKFKMEKDQEAMENTVVSVVQNAREQIPHLPVKPRTASAIWSSVETIFNGGQNEIPDHVRAYYDKYASGGVQSFTERTISVQLEGTDESFTLSAAVSATVLEVKEMMSAVVQIEPDKMRVYRRTGRKQVLQSDREEIASHVVVAGVTSLRRQSKRKYRHPLCIMGAGLGGLQTAIVLKSRGREDFIIIDRCEDFGGASWIACANKFTKLQTERGTYHLDFIVPGEIVPTKFDKMEYKTWPSRDQILIMFRAQAEKHGLREKTRFSTSIQKIQVQQAALGTRGSFGGQQVDEFDRTYMLYTVPVNINKDNKELIEETGDGELIMGSCCASWPGNLTRLNTIEFPGEDAFDGYIEYSSFDRFDYTEVAGKNVILYGHGAFVIENVRTLLEHQAKKVIIMCRRRNICGMRAVSWMVGFEELPIPGHIMLEAMQLMYGLVDYDIWANPSVKTDEKRTFAYIEQKTVFGVTDVYFLAGYYGLMEVIVDEIKRLSRHCAHCLKSGRKINNVEAIVKAVGTLPDAKCDKLLNLKSLVGFWVNGDPLMPISTNGMYVAAKNFGSFSSGPGFVGLIGTFAWFIDFPEDFKVVEKMLPVQKKEAGKACHIAGGPHSMLSFTILSGAFPGLAMEVAKLNAQKAIKQKQTHPIKEYISECTQEWEMYIRKFKDAGMVDDRPDPPYPYTVDIMEHYMDKSRNYWKQRAPGSG